MLLRPGGIDVFYIDESHDKTLYVVTAIAIPFLRNVDGIWQINWPTHLQSAKEWRRRIASKLKIPTSKELHGTKLVSGRGRYIVGKRQIAKEKAADIYCSTLSMIDFVPAESVITVAGSRGPKMFGHERLQRVMYALFQRMRSQCVARNVNALVFFDEGHPEYRALYRRAMINLPTGSRFGGTRNLPLNMFVKDGNDKDSSRCLFTQTADLIAYAALSKIRHERDLMAPEQIEFGFASLYDSVPTNILNLKACSSRPKDGIVRLE